jgi:hypothetical protein
VKHKPLLSFSVELQFAAASFTFWGMTDETFDQFRAALNDAPNIYRIPRMINGLKKSYAASTSYQIENVWYLVYLVNVYVTG